MHFLALIFSLLAITSFVTAVPTNAYPVIDGLTALPELAFSNIDPQFGGVQADGCGTVKVEPSGIGYGLLNDNKCHKFPEEITNVWIGQSKCTCVFGKGGRECSYNNHDLIGWARGPAQGSLKGMNARWVHCW